MIINMKKTIFFALFLSAFNAEAGLFGTDKLPYSQPDLDSRFNEIKKDVVTSIKGVSNYGAADAYNLIRDAQDRFVNLYSKVKKSKYGDDIIDEITSSLDEIAETYEKVANLNEEIFKVRNKSDLLLSNTKNGLTRTVNELDDEINRISNESSNLKSQLGIITDSIEIQKIQIRINGNQSVLGSLLAQKTIWSKFLSSHDKLLDKLQLNDKKIELLLYALKVNAQVYREAANVARLRRSAKAALTNLESLSNVQNVLGDLQSSWGSVDDLVSEISSSDFNLNLDIK